MNRICAVPGCITPAAHGHHIWPRSYLRGQPTEWVETNEGVLSNVVGLCAPHHLDVTGDIGGHRARITYDGGTFWWTDMDPLATQKAALFPQPLGGEQPPDVPIPDAPSEHFSEAHADHGVLVPGQTCPSCGYTKPKPRSKLPKRRTEQWGVMVPADAEIGSEVLDQWVEEFAVILGLDVSSRRLLRYHVLSTVLAWAAQNQGEFIRDVREAGDA